MKEKRKVIFVEMQEIIEELVETINEHYEKRELQQIKTILGELNPADIAVLLEEFPDNQKLLFFRLLSKEDAADTFVELEPDTQEALIHGISDTELREVLDELYLDDAVDIIEEMPATLRQLLLSVF